MSFVMVFSLPVFGAKGAVRTSIGNFCQRRQPYLGIAETPSSCPFISTHTKRKRSWTMFQGNGCSLSRSDAGYPRRSGRFYCGKTIRDAKRLATPRGARQLEWKRCYSRRTPLAGRVLLAGGRLSQASVSRRDRRRGRWQRGLALIAKLLNREPRGPSV